MTIISLIFFGSSLGEDEEEDVCRSFNCTGNFVKCADTLRCILAVKLCDGKEDCLDGSDETAVEFAPKKVNNCTAQGKETRSTSAGQ